MPFCRNCGAETTAGQNYCPNCGLLLKATDIPPPPPPPLSDVPPPQQQPAGTAPPVLPRGMLHLLRPLFIGLAVFLVTSMAMGYLLGVPVFSYHAGEGSATPEGPALNATAAEPTVTETITPTTLPTPVLVLDKKYEATYERIYSSNRSYMFGDRVTIPHTLTRPPLYIKFSVIPEILNESRLVDIGTSSEREIFVVYPDPAAWFEVTVLAASGGSVAGSGGYGISKGYSAVNDSEFMVRSAGDYVIELAGNKVIADTEIRIGAASDR